jgi:cytoskeletal protein CcmA (bactofilin family)
MKLRVLLAVVLAALALPAVTSAADGKRKDQVVISGSVTVPKEQTAGDIVIVDGPVRIDGKVTGDVIAVAGKVTISGQVDGDVTVVANRLRLLHGARVGGDVHYGDEKPIVDSGASVAGKISDEGWREVGTSTFAWALGLIVWLAVTVSTLILGILLVALVPRALEAAWEAAEGSLGAVIAMGVGLFIGVPIVAVLIAATAFGLPLGILIFLAMLPLYALGYVTSAWMVGRRVLSGRRDRFVPFLVGLLILRVIALIPVLGGLVGLAATALGLGALGLAAWRAGGEGRLGPRPAGAPATS